MRTTGVTTATTTPICCGICHRIAMRASTSGAARARSPACWRNALAHVLALDLSPEMIRVAEDRSAGYPNIIYQVADVLAWDFPVERFDCVASIATFHHLPMEPMLAAIKAALKPGGVLLILDLYESQGWGERLDAGLAMSASLALRWLHNGRIRESEAARQAWAAHGAHDVYLRLSQVREIARAVLPGAVVKRHLFWRYSLVWRKPR